MPTEPDTPGPLGPAVRSLAAGARIFGRYDLQRKVGEGGFGSVWLARDRELEEDIALKFVLQVVANSPEALDALKREAARSRRLTHRHIVRIHDFVAGRNVPEDADLAAVSMEYVDGESLNDLRLRQPGRCFDVAEVASWIGPLCDALSYAHTSKARVIHRDLKPANILLTADGEVKVADFGIACSLADSVSQVTGQRRSGTPAFMSPQQVLGEYPSESDDMYSLGATLYTLLTGTPPFFQGDVYAQIKAKTPDSMTERRRLLEVGNRPPIPAEWEQTIAACLAKSAYDRPQSVAEIPGRLGFGSGSGALFTEPPPAAPLNTSDVTQRAYVPWAELAELTIDPALAKALKRTDPTLKSRPKTSRPKVRQPKVRAAKPRSRKGLLVALAVVLGSAATAAGWFFLFGGGTAGVLLAAPENLHLARHGLYAGIQENKADRWGFVDGAGQQVIAPQWNWVGSEHDGSFQHGRALVRREGKYGFIDAKGAEVIPAQWTSAEAFSEGLAAVKSELKWGYLNAKGETTILPRWEEAEPFHQGLAKVKFVGANGARYGYIDPLGREIVALQWLYLSAFSDGLAAAYDNSLGKWGYVDTKGKIALTPRWDTAGAFSAGLAPVKAGGKFGYVNPSGEQVLPPQWLYAYKFADGLAEVCPEGHLRGFIDTKGKEVVPPVYGNVNEFSHGLAEVSRNGKWGCIDTKGKVVVPLDYDTMRPFAGGLAPVVANGSWGVIDQTGKVLVPAQWDYCITQEAENGKGYAFVARAKKAAPLKFGESSPAEAKWFDSKGKEIWHSP